MAKKGKKQQSYGDWSDSEEEGMDTTPQNLDGTPAEEKAETPAPESAEASPAPGAPEEATMDDLADEFEGGGLMGALRKSKKKKDAKDAKEAQAEPEEAPVVLTKKQKEKLKKEQEKAKKKAAADARKAAADAKKAAEPEKKEKTPEPEKKEEKKEEKPAAAPKKLTGRAAAIAKIKAQQDAIKAQEAAEAAAEEEERLAEEAAQRAVEEAEKEKEAARLAKKERERQKIERQKAEGTYMTKKQKQERAAAEARREQMLAAGMIVGGRAPQQQQNNRMPSRTPQAKPKVEEKKVEAKVEKVEKAEPKAEEESPEDVDALMDDWETALDSDGEVKDDWEAMADENGEIEITKKEDPAAKAKEEAEAAAKEAEAQAQALARQKAADEGTQLNDETELERQRVAAEEALEEARRKSAAIAEKRAAKHSRALAGANAGNLRSPICCILGHVDTGKTKLLDKVRQTNVQEGEAGGITQQIGATYFPIDAIKKKTEVMQQYGEIDYMVPGLLVIDTPGHESFTNLRSRGSSLCNIAILVIDIMHGLEQQTIESIKLLRDKKTPFVVALNKIDRLFDWEAIPNNSFRDSLSKQKKSVVREFEDRLEKTKTALMEQGLNSEVYYKNKNLAKNVSLVPTSAITGEGIPDLLALLLQLTQSRMSKQLMYLSELEATVLEVKVVEGFGTTIDVVLSNGVLREGDRVVLCGQNGPIATNVRALLTPQPLRELRVKSAYVHHKEVKAALGVKIAANDLDKAVAGSRLLLVGPDDDEEDLMDDVMDDLTGLLDSVDKSGRGVCVQASTLGSLEALLDFLKDMKIPVMSIALGPVYKKDVMRATTMLEKDKSLAIMLCFDVKIDKDAERYADEQGVKLFSADIIYHLFDDFVKHQKKLQEQKRLDTIDKAVFPCVLHTVQIINKRSPMIIGVDVVEGSLRVGTPICAVKQNPETGAREVLELGKVTSMEVNHKSETIVRKGQTNAGVAMRIDTTSGQPTWGRHIDEKDVLYSSITRKSIDTLKDPVFRNDVPREDWLLLRNLKTTFGIK
ncbi:Eukaryotic translation initiation factor 5B [Yarrowia sp. B02]|nr:Eukaryotic translation initiation factor 5B [Yarrowia sp. B02]